MDNLLDTSQAVEPPSLKEKKADQDGPRLHKSEPPYFVKTPGIVVGGGGRDKKNG